jgi:lauroyl/myristoyl acyltransferase
MKRISAHLVGRAGLSRFLQWPPNAILMRYLPFWLGRAYVGFMGRVYFLFNRSEVDEIKHNLTAVIRKMPRTDPIDLIIRRTFHEIFSHYHEKLITAYANYHKVCRFIKSRVLLERQNLLDQALAQGRGVVLITAHFGAVEFLPTILALSDYRVTMVVRFKTDRLKRALKQRAARLGITLLDASNGERIIFSACQALKSNQILITECDEFEAWRPDRTRTTSFLGCTSPLDRTLELLRRRDDSPLIMGLVCRSKGNCYELMLHSLNGISQNPESPTTVERALRILEQYIILAPEQWYQWKQLRTALGAKFFEETRPHLATEANRSLSIADSTLHTHEV